MSRPAMPWKGLRRLVLNVTLGIMFIGSRLAKETADDFIRWDGNLSRLSVTNLDQRSEERVLFESL